MIFPMIKNLRIDNDLKQSDLASYLSIDQTTYSKYELGRLSIPVDVLIKLADYYGVSVDYLLGRTNYKYTYIQK